MREAASELAARLILLGASNLTKSIDLALDAARQALEIPAGRALDVRLAYGHGRSYGIDSTVLGRRLPGIVPCGLWEDLPEPSDAVPTFALLTDVGNDIMYGVDVDPIVAWVQLCLERLEQHSARIVMTGLPLPSVQRLRPSQFRIAKGLLFPRSPVTFEQVRNRALAVEQRLAALAEERSIPFVRPAGDWYGIDPIHIRPGRRRAVWGAIAGHWRDEPPSPPVRARGSLHTWLAVRRGTPERWWLLGRQFERPQPAVRLGDGTTVALY